MGIGIATFEVVNAGIASLPTPLSEVGDETWLWHHMFSVHNPLLITDDIGPGAYQRIQIDSKAKRKFPDGMALYAAMEVVEVGTATMTVFLDTRMLVLLP